jgi:hypothetical protein
MKSLLTLILISAIPLGVYAQNTTLEGVVSDSLNNPIELANVMAFHKEDSTVASFGITDGAGRYKLILPSDKNYTLKSSFMGYSTWESDISTNSESITQNLVLFPISKILNDVEIRYEFPITVSGDTIIYKTDQFTSGKERKLGDVLEALPGFEIDDNGDIKVQGKKVSKVLVDGKEFFDGDSKMATQNIPADAVDKIQLLRNYSDISPLSGLGNDDNLAINVKLAEDKKNIWFGDVEVSAGANQRYLVHPNLFYYSPKTNINLIGDANNIGEQSFTLSDYFRFTGGVRRIGQKSGSSMRLSADDIGISLMQNMMAKNIDSKLGAVNINYQPNKKWRISAYGIASGVKTIIETTSDRTYIRTQEETTEKTSSYKLQENTSGLLKLSTAYTPSHRTHLEYSAFLNTSNISENDQRTSNFGQVNNFLNEQDDKSPLAVDQSLVGYYTINEKNVLSTETSWQYKKQVPKYALSTQLAPLQSLLPLTLSNSYQINQNKTITTNILKGEVNHYLILNKTNHINFTAGINNNQQQFDSQIKQIQDDGSTTSIGNMDFDNDVNFKFQDYYLGAHYKAKLGKLTLSPGINWHQYQINDDQLGSENKRTKQLVVPDVFAKYDFSSSKNITLNYSLNAEFTDVQNVAMRGYINNYNSYFNGNRDIENTLYHQVNVSYFNFNMFNHTNLFATVNYQQRYNDITQGVNYVSNDQITNVLNVPVWNDQLMTNASIEKKFVHVKMKAEANVTYSSFQNEVEQQTNDNTSLNQEYTLSAESKFSNAPNFEIGFKKGRNIYSTNTVRQEYATNSPFIDIEVPLLKSFTLIMDYEYNNYQNDERTTVSNYDFMNASLYYEKEDSPWTLKLSANNILQTSAIRRDNFSSNIVSTFSYEVLPRYLMLSVKYNL